MAKRTKAWFCYNLLMLVGTYNFSSSGPVCAMLFKDSEVVDISVSNIVKDELKTKRALVKKGTQATASLVEKYGLHGEIRVCFPSILKGEQQEKMLEDALSQNSKVEFSRTPFATTGAIARISSEDGVAYPCFDSFEEPLRVYTDASVKDDQGEPTIGVGILDSDGHVLSFFGERLSGFQRIDRAELEAGFRGLEHATDFGAGNVEWISDNHDAQAVFDEEKTSETCTSELEDRAKNIRDSFDSFNYTDIQGTDNVFADAIAEDAYRDELDDRFSFTAELE